MLTLEQKHTGMNPQTQMHGCTSTHTHLLTLPRFICQDDSWTLAAVEFARHNPLLGRREPEHPGKHSETHFEAVVQPFVCVLVGPTFQNTQQQHGKVQPLFSFCLCLAEAGLAGSSLFCQASSQHQMCIMLPPLPRHLSSFAFPLRSGSLDICLPHDTSQVGATVGWEECTICFPSKQPFSCVQWKGPCNYVTGYFFNYDKKGQCKGNFSSSTGSL